MDKEQQDEFSKYVKTKSESASKDEEDEHVGGGIPKSESVLDVVPKINKLGLDTGGFDY